MRFNPAFPMAMLVVVAAGCNSGGSGSASGSGDHKGLTKLISQDVVVGKGDPVESGDEVWVVYTGKLVTGHIFDSNAKGDKPPFHVEVGNGGVIKGWDQGLIGMREGGKRKLSIPYTLAYGDRSQSEIPAKSDLYFDIELKTVLKKKDARVITANDVKVGTGREAKVGDTVVISYEGTANGEPFESYDKVPPFKIGGDKMTISNFDMALVGMKVGGERKISVPPSLTRMLRIEKLGASVAVYDVKLLDVK